MVARMKDKHDLVVWLCHNLVRIECRRIRVETNVYGMHVDLAFDVGHFCYCRAIDTRRSSGEVIVSLSKSIA